LQPPAAPADQQALTVKVDNQAVVVAPPAPKRRNVKMQRGAHELTGIVNELDPGTEYTLNWLPIGGFVRMWGEEGAVGKGSFNDAPKRWRAATLLAGPGMNLLIALLVFTITYMAGYPSTPAVVKQVPASSPAAAAGLRLDDAILSVDRKPLRSLDDVKAYIDKHAGQVIPLLVLRNGQTVQVDLPASATGADALRGVVLEEELRVGVGNVAKDSPAEKAQIEPGDVIVAVDGQRLTRADQLPAYVKEHAGQSVTVLLQRGSDQREVSLIPRTPEQTPEGQGAMGVQLDYLNYKLVKYSLSQAVANAVDDMSYTVQQIVTLPTRLLARQIAPSEAQVVGPVGISQFAAAAVSQTTSTGEPFWFLNLFAAISLALAITNLLPLPALDGGRLIFIMLEAVRGKRISPEREAVVHFVGMMVLLALMVLITIQDIGRLTN
jgi:regulator of sigma E protease